LRPAPPARSRLGQRAPPWQVPPARAKAPPNLALPDSAPLEILAEVDTSTIDQTIDNFKRDQHPASEVVIFERIAATYQL
jgi:hypothetical protein